MYVSCMYLLFLGKQKIDWLRVTRGISVTSRRDSLFRIPTVLSAAQLSSECLAAVSENFLESYCNVKVSLEALRHK